MMYFSSIIFGVCDGDMCVFLDQVGGRDLAMCTYK